jgi:tetratricopeptide (TPR) repeat protein
VLQVRRIPDPLVRRAGLAFFGEMAEAERISNSLGGNRLDVLQKFYRHFVLRQQGKLLEAAEVMRAQAEEVRAQNNANFLFVTSYLLAETLLEAGRAAEAAAVWPATLPCRCTDPLEYANNYPTLTLVRARAMEQLGRRDDAIRELDGLLTFWKRADDDLPLLVEAKAMRARLTSR